jgi:hydrogenase nickel incorporation protein HypA/HybF
MHEMGITASILETAVEAAEAQGGTSINTVRITVGDLTEIVEEALQFAWVSMREETMAAGADLVVTKLPALYRCTECDNEFVPGRFDFLCPKCESYLCEVLQGRELRIDSIEIEKPDDEAPTADLG